MDFLILVIKSALSIIILFLLTKALGKKTINQLNIFDYVIGISIGNIVAEISINPELNFLYGVVAMIVYTIISILTTYITTKSIILRRLISGTPTIIIENGKIIENGLKKSKLDINELLEESRLNGFFDISEIEYAIMEANGRVSFLPKSKYKPIIANDLKIKKGYQGLCSNLIIDGKIMKKNLIYINKDINWLKKRLKKMGYDDIENLILVTCNAKEELVIYEKNIKEKLSGCLE